MNVGLKGKFNSIVGKWNERRKDGNQKRQQESRKEIRNQDGKNESRNHRSNAGMKEGKSDIQN